MQEAKRECYGSWYLPAGRMEPRETVVEAMRREVQEETGLQCRPLTLLAVEERGPAWIRFVFLARPTGGGARPGDARGGGLAGSAAGRSPGGGVGGGDPPAGANARAAPPPTGGVGGLQPLGGFLVVPKPWKAASPSSPRARKTLLRLRVSPALAA